MTNFKKFWIENRKGRIIEGLPEKFEKVMKDNFSNDIVKLWKSVEIDWNNSKQVNNMFIIINRLLYLKQDNQLNFGKTMLYFHNFYLFDNILKLSEINMLESKKIFNQSRYLFNVCKKIIKMLSNYQYLQYLNDDFEQELNCFILENYLLFYNNKTKNLFFKKLFQLFYRFKRDNINIVGIDIEKNTLNQYQFTYIKEIISNINNLDTYNFSKKEKSFILDVFYFNKY